MTPSKRCKGAPGAARRIPSAPDLSAPDLNAPDLSRPFQVRRFPPLFELKPPPSRRLALSASSKCRRAVACPRWGSVLRSVLSFACPLSARSASLPPRLPAPPLLQTVPRRVCPSDPLRALDTSAVPVSTCAPRQNTRVARSSLPQCQRASCRVKTSPHACSPPRAPSLHVLHPVSPTAMANAHRVAIKVCMLTRMRETRRAPPAVVDIIVCTLIRVGRILGERGAFHF